MKRFHYFCGIAALCLTALAPSTSIGATKVKVAFVATLSGPQALLGKHMQDGFLLGVEELKNTFGGLPAEISTNDDQFKPDVARQIAERVTKRDEVDVVTGAVFSNIVLAMNNTLADAKTMFVNSSGGASQLGGKSCSPFFISTAWQTDQVNAAVGQQVQAAGLKKVVIIISNYTAGQDAANGFKRTFKGQVLREMNPPLTQNDFSAELTQIATLKPDAVFVFIAGYPGVSFVKQYASSGLKQNIPLYSTFTAYGPNLPAIGDAALGARSVGHWTADLDNPANKRFVAAFQKKYGYTPSNISAQSYDAAMLIDAAVRKVGGKVEDRDAFARAFAQVQYDSVRGPYRYGKNNFPVQNFYQTEVVRNEDGSLVEANRGLLIKDDVDVFAAECPMK